MTFVLSEFQLKAIESIENGHHTLVTAHTGSGKTLPAEHAIKYFTNKGKKVIYTSPIKALSNQKYAEFTKKFPELQIGILTGDNKHNPSADVIIMTTEILQNNLLKTTTHENSYLNIDIDIDTELGCVIFDEIHYIDDPERGTVWEQCIITLPKHIQMVMLSATIGEKEKFASWIETIKENKVNICSTNTRVVPLSFNIYLTVPKKTIERMPGPMKSLFENKNNKIESLHSAFNETIDMNKKCHHYLKSNDISVSKQFVLNELCLKLKEKEMFPALFFVFSRKQVQQYANDMSAALFDPGEKDYLVEPICRQLLVSRVKNWKEYMALPEYKYYIDLLEKGIGIHHAGMLSVFREMIEILYDQKYIKVLFATETFSIGLNMPTKTVCFTSLYKHDGRSMRLIHSHEFIQMAGRAGRRNIDTIGHVIMMTNLYDPLDTTQYYKLMNSSPKILKSKFKIDYSLFLHYLNNYSLEECKHIIEKSLMNQDILNQIKQSNEKLDALQLNLNTIIPLLKNQDVCELYLYLKKELVTSKNSIRKQISKKINEIENSNREIKSQIELYEKFETINNDIEIEKSGIKYAEHFIESQLNSLNTILHHNSYVDNDNKLTIKGLCACSIREIHPLIFCDFYEKYDKFNGLSSSDIFCILSCLYDVKVSDEFKEFTPSMFKEELKFINERIYYYYDEEVKYQLVNMNQELQYDIMPYIKRWMDTCDDSLSSIQLIQEIKSQKGWFTGDFIKCCLKLINMSKEIESICEPDLLEKLKEGSSKILKFICSNESLYLN
uniref:Helicase n=1 Tax=viral metagenome TaxID=1070528 RepID=A0A6C0JJD6_9ZZZZ